MAILSIVAPEIPAEAKDKFLGAWPTLSAELTAQPGVAGTSGGIIVAEDGAPVTDFKFVQVIAFASAKDAEDFAASPFAEEHKARYRERTGTDATVGRFEVPELPGDKAPPPFTQYSTLVLEDESIHAEVRKAWMDVVQALGKETFGGRSVDGPFVGLGIIGWNSLEEAGAAFKEPKAAAAWATYQALGKGKNVIVKGL
ncbi:hypothetical protein F5X68DRAFT_242873 [Plectosphaerella plurivora]|uniref:Uncharacterized protein n=1 Tax=Plectosphaerella plurivora TaxID=936078 RepID=A0A9P9A9N7_9PEZI|nr:hypothetical protein F5X68DRAFT_242873 [Plectosphaerella plurivora]